MAGLRGRFYDIEAALRDATPTLHAAATQILIGTDDRIWVGMWPTGEGVRWLVLSPTGQPQSEVRLPPGVRLRDAGADYILCTVWDEFDVESSSGTDSHPADHRPDPERSRIRSARR